MVGQARVLPTSCIIDDFKRSIAASPTLGNWATENEGLLSCDLPGADQNNCINFSATVYFNEANRRFCTGLVSYIWNYRDTPVANRNVYDTPGTRPVIRLIKVRDPQRSYCTADAGGNFPNVRVADNPEELLGESEENIWLYNLVIYPNNSNNTGRNINTHNGQVFYSGSFVLGTRERVIIDGNNPQCAAPNTAQENIDEAIDGLDHYCSVNKFNFAQRAARGSQ